MSAPAAVARGSRWESAWQHRDTLLRVARRRTQSEDEAQDAVSEALVRAIQADNVDEDRLAAWLTTVTVNLCTDFARERARWPRRAAYTRLHLVPEPSPEQTVIDRDLAAAVVRRINRLPERQREALMLRAAGLPVDDIADRLEVTYKTAESLLARARTALRGSIAVWVAGAVAAAHALRRGLKAAPVTTAASMLAFATFSVTTLPGQGDQPAPAGPATAVQPLRLDAKQVHPAKLVTTHHQVVPSHPLRHRTTTSNDDKRASARAVVPPAAVERGKFHASSGGVTRERPEESALDTVLRCVRERPALTSNYIGCP